MNRPTNRRSITWVLAAVAVPLLLAACTGGGGTGAASPLPTIPSLAPETPTPVPTHPGPTYPPGCPESQPDALAAGETRTVTLETDKGDIVIEVKADLSPIAAGNFVALADCGFYDNVIFHRVVPNFVIQGGDGQFGRAPDWIPGMAGTGGPGYTIEDEPVTAKYGRGTVAWARTAQPNSVGSQFFIVTDDAARGPLESYNTYQIFGEVVEGMDVVDAITEAAAGVEQPENPVVIKKATVSTP
jgi:peptidyl-prolyl cis-trans isomerase B (cyclophilin B)